MSNILDSEQQLNKAVYQLLEDYLQTCYGKPGDYTFEEFYETRKKLITVVNRVNSTLAELYRITASDVNWHMEAPFVEEVGPTWLIGINGPYEISEESHYGTSTA